jgi:hypothetical protein
VRAHVADPFPVELEDVEDGVPDPELDPGMAVLGLG